MKSGTHFGMFLEQMSQGHTQAEAFKETFDLVDAAESYGIDGVWLGELHFLPNRSVFSSPIVLASSIATRTRRLRVGTAVQVLPLGSPIRMAEEVATIDHISQGRFEFGVGRSGAVRTYDVLGVPYGESQSRFLEALEIMLEAWKGETFSYHGKHYDIRNATVSPRPFQHPHPPIRMAANTRETFEQVGRLGLYIFVGLRGMDVSELRQRVQTYRTAWRDGGHPGEGSVYLRIPIYAGATAAAALEEPRATITYYFQRQAEIQRASAGRAGDGPAERRHAQADAIASLTYEQILANRVAFGSGPQLIDRLKSLQDVLTLDGIVGEFNPGGMLSLPQQLQSLRRFADEVMPAFR
jgi:alkanesulfonate monooxygenase SsuD/methylene tetrahydromethanopterin reductase-like flavin-dependent oxidoreductase (luciferase family)